MEKEIWKTIDGFENYQVSNLGNVKRIKCMIIYSNGNNCNYAEKQLIKETTRDNYQRVTLSKNGKTNRFQLHRLVSSVFIENKDKKPCVNHIDGNKLNNNVENLEWCTYSENEKHSYDFLGKITNGIKSRKLNKEDVLNILKNYKSGVTQKKIAQDFDVNQSTISLIINNKTYAKHF